MAAEDLSALFTSLQKRGFTTIGPTIAEGAIVYDAIDGPEQLPVGWTDRHAAGEYRLERREDQAYFGYNVGPFAYKKFLFPPRVTMLSVEKQSGGTDIQFIDRRIEQPPPRQAFIGVRSCELHAIQIQDRVFIGDNPDLSDPLYRGRRENLFIVAASCIQAGGTCFCVSTNTGPQVNTARTPADLHLIEVPSSANSSSSAAHYFLIEADSEEGRSVLEELPVRPATSAEIEAGRTRVDAAADQMGRTVDLKHVREKLLDRPEHPRWEETAKRCLACANCTMVCPTCFCSTVEDTTDLAGETAERSRRWDSCFTMGFSYTNGGPVRSSTAARYRQWLTHKFASWHDQFDTQGCVGCGRCITWCPVGIDVTEELEIIQGTQE